MWSFMESARPSVFTASNGEGVERVAKGKGELKDIFERKEIRNNFAFQDPMPF